MYNNFCRDIITREGSHVYNQSCSAPETVKEHITKNAFMRLLATSASIWKSATETICRYCSPPPPGVPGKGTALKDAIAAIDSQASPAPQAYLVNCTHASIFRRAIFHEQNSSALVRKRVIGLLANTAALSPEELDNSSELVEEEPEVFATDVAALQKELGLRIVGGCCGTDERHIDSLARQLVERMA